MENTKSFSGSVKTSSILQKVAGEGKHSKVHPQAQNLKLSAQGTPEKTGPKPDKGSVGIVRHFIAVLALSSIVLANMNRQAFNQALVSMTKSSNVTETKQQVVADKFKVNQTYSTVIPDVLNSTEEVESIFEEEYDDRFDWSQSRIATLQSAFSFGYTPFMIPGGRLCEIYGAKWIVFMSGFGSGLCTIFTPLLADYNFSLLVISRTLMGLCQTAVSPALFAICVRWLPQSEYNVYLPMMKVGVMIGFMTGSLVSGFSTWRVTFYIVGLISLMWSAIWAFLVSSDPTESKFLSEGELEFIQSELHSNTAKQQSNSSADRKTSAPWLAIFTNPVVIAFSLAKFTVKMSTDVQTMQIPLYLRNIFHVSKELNGMLSATNFAIQSIFTGLIAYIAKELVVRKSYGISKTGVRRLFQGLCNFGMAAAYILISMNMSSIEVVCSAIIMLSVSAMFGAGGEALTPVDISPEYSATIMAIANSFANCSGLVLPTIVSLILNGATLDPDSWNRVWLVIGTIMFLGGMIYFCIVTAEPQDFRKRENEKSNSGQPTEMVAKL